MVTHAAVKCGFAKVQHQTAITNAFVSPVHPAMKALSDFSTSNQQQQSYFRVQRSFFFFPLEQATSLRAEQASLTTGDGSGESELAICDYAGLLESKMKVNIHGLTHSSCRMFFHATMTILLSTERGGGRCCGKYSLGRKRQ